MRAVKRQVARSGAGGVAGESRVRKSRSGGTNQLSFRLTVVAIWRVTFGTRFPGKTSSQNCNASPKRRERQPDVFDLARHDRGPLPTEKSPHADRRNVDGPPGEKITRRVKRREKRHAQSAIGHGVQQAM